MLNPIVGGDEHSDHSNSTEQTNKYRTQAKTMYWLGASHGWFHSYQLRQCVRNVMKARITKWKKKLPTVGMCYVQMDTKGFHLENLFAVLFILNTSCNTTVMLFWTECFAKPWTKSFPYCDMRKEHSLWKSYVHVVVFNLYVVWTHK